MNCTVLLLHQDHYAGRRAQWRGGGCSDGPCGCHLGWRSCRLFYDEYNNPRNGQFFEGQMRYIEQQAKRELATEVDAIQNAFMDEAVFREAMAWPRVPARLARSSSGTSSGSSDPWNMSVQRSTPYPSPATSEGAVSRSNGSSQMAKSIQPVTLRDPMGVPIGASASQEAAVEDLPEGWMVHVAREGRFTGRTFYSYPGANGDRVSTWSLPPNPKDLPVITRLGGRL